jgi:hypothetical protein
MSVDAEPFADRPPSYLTRFVGREQEIAELEAMVEPMCRCCCAVLGAVASRPVERGPMSTCANSAQAGVRTNAGVVAGRSGSTSAGSYWP